MDNRKPFAHPTSKVIINIPDAQISAKTGPDEVALERQKRLEETKLTPLAQLQAQLEERKAQKSRRIIQGIIGGTLGALAIASGVIILTVRSRNSDSVTATNGTDSNTTGADLPAARALATEAPSSINSHPEPVATVKTLPTTEPSATPTPSIDPIATATATAVTVAMPSVKPASTAPKWQNKQPPKPNTGGIMREVPF